MFSKVNLIESLILLLKFKDSLSYKNTFRTCFKYCSICQSDQIDFSDSVILAKNSWRKRVQSFIAIALAPFIIIQSPFLNFQH